MRKSIYEGIFFMTFIVLMQISCSRNFCNKLTFPCTEMPEYCIDSSKFALDTATNKLYYPGELIYSGKNRQLIKDLNILIKRIEKTNRIYNPEIDTCICGESIFLIRDSSLIGKESVIAENTTSESKKEGGGFSLNYLITPDIQPIPASVRNEIATTDFNIDEFNFSHSSQNTDTSIVKIAFLDTGINPAYISNGKMLPSIVNPSICSDTLSDHLGWDFISNNSLPYDDDGHGTIVYKAFEKAFTETCNSNRKVQYLFVKTLDSCGIGSSFSNACGLHYARIHNVDYINCSWGFYEGDLQIEEAVFEAVSDSIKIICSSGNKKMDLDAADSPPHFPSGYAYPFNPMINDYTSSDTRYFQDYVYEVGGLCMAPTQNLNNRTPIWTTANKRKVQYVEAATSYEEILNLSTTPGCNICGTSFAAPTFLGAMVAKRGNQDFTNPLNSVGTSISNWPELKRIKSNYYSIRHSPCTK